MSLSQRNRRSVLIDLKLSNLDLSGNTWNSKHCRRPALAHLLPRDIIYLRWNLSKFVVLKHFGREFLYGEPCCCLDVSVYMLKCVFC